MNTLSWFFDFPTSTGMLIIGTLAVAALTTITFARGMWRL